MDSIRRAVEELDPDLLPTLWFRTIENGPLRLQRSMAQIAAIYAGTLASVALILAAAGIYGVMAYLVNQRVREIGIRMALGSTAATVLKTIVLDGLRPVFVGIGLGIMGAGALSWIQHTSLAFPGAADFFYGVPFYDPTTFLGLSAVFIFMAAIATFVPAQRAMRVDPMIALRHD